MTASSLKYEKDVTDLSPACIQWAMYVLNTA